MLRLITWLMFDICDSLKSGVKNKLRLHADFILMHRGWCLSVRALIFYYTRGSTVPPDPGNNENGIEINYN